MRHRPRGPDAGTCGRRCGRSRFSHRRLAVLDLSDDGRQQMLVSVTPLSHHVQRRIYTTASFARAEGLGTVRSSSIRVLLGAIDCGSSRRPLQRAIACRLRTVGDAGRHRIVWPVTDREKRLYDGRIGANADVAIRVRVVRQEASRFTPTVDRGSGPRLPAPQIYRLRNRSIEVVKVRRHRFVIDPRSGSRGRQSSTGPGEKCRVGSIGRR